MRLGGLLLSICALRVHHALAVAPLVNLTYSKFYGTAQSNGITSWFGMRYGAPPVGDLRFRAPQEPAQNDTVQIANEHALLCLATPAAQNDPTMDEDCLFLDVYAPTNATTSSKLPVYFFIQGGGFNSNYFANYGGDGIIQASDYNIVVVTFNQRVGLYGFLASQEVEQDGDLNVGFLDEVMALEWVQSHISMFGGDPDHVVLGGGSSGGASILMHMTAYGGQNNGLFHAVAAESATFVPMLTVSESQYQYDALTERVGCAGTTDSLACLRQLNASYLQANNFNIPYPGSGPNALAPNFMYSPAIDGSLIPDYTVKLLSEGKFIPVPAIFGDDTNGGTILTPMNISSYAEMDKFLKDQFPELTEHELAAINAMYPKAEQFPDSGPYWRTASNALGEKTSMCLGLSTSSALSKATNQSSWSYRYNVIDPTDEAIGYGVPHAVEIIAIWGPQYVTGVVKPLIPPTYNTTNAAIIPLMQAYWTSFIRSYNPNTYRLAGTPEWEPWVESQQNRLMIQTNVTAMETVAEDQQARCAYLIGHAVRDQQ